MLEKKARSTMPPRSDSKEQAGDPLVVTLIRIACIPHGCGEFSLI
jgi:hypothetical protein